MATILVVDDDPFIRMFAVEVLRERGHVVDVFTTASEAHAYCGQPGNTFQAMLTHIGTASGVSGLDLARYISETRPGVRVVITSDRQRPITKPVDGMHFLPKPWGSAELFHALGL